MKKELFRLKKVKVEKNLVTINYKSNSSDKEYTEKSKIQPHPDFINALKKFGPLVAEVFDMPEENKDKLTINGIVISEKNDSEQVMVLSTFETMSGAKVAINTPNISMETDHWAGQGTLGEDSDGVVDECYQYLFKNKAAQLVIPMEEDNGEQL